MGIQSQAFGRVTLTEDDARKFRNQVTYGKPKKQAMVAVKRSAEVAKALSEGGSFKLKVAVRDTRRKKEI